MAYQLAVCLLLVYSALATAEADETCVDVISNCRSYGHQACVDYADWAHINCPYTCQFCQGPTPPRECKDLDNNCHDYVEDVCTNEAYRTWAEDNCYSYCGLCGTPSIAPTTQSSHPPTTQSSHPPATQSSHPPTTQSSHPPATQSSHPPTTQSSHPPATQSSHPPTTSSAPNCDDLISFCSVYSQLACNVTTWAGTYCSKYCHLC